MAVQSDKSEFKVPETAKDYIGIQKVLGDAKAGVEAEEIVVPGGVGNV